MNILFRAYYMVSMLNEAVIVIHSSNLYYITILRNFKTLFDIKLKIIYS